MSNHWFPNGCGVSVETIDGLLDLSDVAWQKIAPCGCVSGVTVGAIGEDEIIATPAQAAVAFAETKAERDRDHERGFTYRPREHNAACAEMADCPHVPKWGVEPRPTPEGYVWAAVHCLGANPKLRHLVSAEHVERVKEKDMTILYVKPLCGGKAAYWWKDEWYATTGKVECKRCWAKGGAA